MQPLNFQAASKMAKAEPEMKAQPLYRSPPMFTPGGSCGPAVRTLVQQMRAKLGR